MDCPTAIEVENESKRLKRDLESWREILVPLYSVLTWEQPAFAGIIPACTTILFLFFWYMDYSLLTTVAILGLLWSLADYGIPLIAEKFFSPYQWNGVKERKLDLFCKNLAEAKIYTCFGVRWFWGLRKNRPKMFYFISFPILLSLIYIGNSINNVLLTYLIVTGSLLYPGIKHKGYLDLVFAPISKYLKCSSDAEKKKE